MSEEDLERGLARLRGQVPAPNQGLFGQTSELWRVNRHAALFLGGGRAALLQLAHPAVAQAIADHSNAASDPFARFQRTFYRVFAMVYGDVDSAFEAARGVHRVHRRISGVFAESAGCYLAGSAYRANDPDALLWVHSTLWETSVLVFETLIEPLPQEAKERYYGETRRFADLFGIDRALLPETWSSFLDYNREMWSSKRLAGTRAGRDIVRSLFQPRLQMPWPVAGWYRTLTTGLLPDRLRAELGLTYGRRERKVFARSIRWLKRSHSLWPKRLRFVPPYLQAIRRIEGRTGRDRIGEAMTRLYTGSR